MIRHRFRITLRVKLMLLLVVLSIVLAGSMSIMLIRGGQRAQRYGIAQTREQLLRQVVRAGKTLARQMVVVVESALITGDQRLVEMWLEAAVRDGEVIYAALVSQDGTIVARVGNLPDQGNGALSGASKSTDLLVSEQRDQDHDIVDIQAPVAVAGEYWGLIRIGLTSAVADNEREGVERRVAENMTAIGRMAMLLMAFFVGLGLLVAIVGSHTLTAPIQRLVSGAQCLANGDFEEQIPVTSQDEIGDLARAFNQVTASLKMTFEHALAISTGDLSQEIVLRSERDTLSSAFQQMSDYLRAMAAVATRISEGDLAVQVTPISERDVLGNAFHVMISNLGHVLSEIREGADQVAKEAEGLTASADQMASATAQNQAQAHEVSTAAGRTREKMMTVASAISEMTATVTEITISISETGDMVQQANTEAQSTQHVIQDLVASSAKISEISQLIAAIASQTNLLALNATIEAARAGESGRGFAVVAGEVKALARETGSAITEIDETIDTIQNMASRALEAVERIVSVIQQVAETFAMISAAMEEQSTMTREINISTQHANQQVEDMFRMNESIETSEQHIAQGAEQVKDSALTLNILAGELYKLLNQFTLE